MKNIIEYQLTDLHCTGESNVEVIYIDGSNESFELASLIYSNKGIDIRAPEGSNSEFSKMTQGLKEKIAKIKRELHESDIEIQKELHGIHKQCETIDPNVSDLSIRSLFVF